MRVCHNEVDPKSWTKNIWGPLQNFDTPSSVHHLLEYF